MVTRFNGVNQKPVPFRERAWQISATESLGRFGSLLFRFWLFLLCRFGGSLGLGHDWHVHPFENGALAGVALALVEANDSRVAAVTIFLGGCDFGEENFHCVFLMK